MRGGIAALLLTLGLLSGLSGCGDSDEDSDTFEDAVSSATNDEPDIKAIARDALRGQDPQFSALSDADLDNLFGTVCEGFDGGLDAEIIAMAGMETFDDAIGAVMMGSVMGYCPEHRIKVDVWMDGYS